MNPMEEKKLITWLLKGDVSIQYQTKRDLLGEDDAKLQKRIALEGWGQKFLSNRHSNGHWGDSYYQPKWISTHYTLLDLKNLGIQKDHPAIKESVNMILDENKSEDGGINPHREIGQSDVCVNGMFLNIASYFQSSEDKLKSMVDCLLNEHMADGGFNCRSNRSGAVHSSVHSTLSVMEGVHEYKVNGYTYRLDELQKAWDQSLEFLLMHRLYKSDRTGKIIHKDFLRLSYPGRWRYDILRCLDHLALAKTPWDDRMSDALKVILKKRLKDGTWPLQAKIPGKTHFDMEKAGKPSRWNTLRVLRILNHLNKTA